MILVELQKKSRYFNGSAGRLLILFSLMQGTLEKVLIKVQEHMVSFSSLHDLNLSSFRLATQICTLMSLTLIGASTIVTSHARSNIRNKRGSPSAAQIALALILLKSKPVELSVEDLPTPR